MSFKEEKKGKNDEYIFKININLRQYFINIMENMSKKKKRRINVILR